MNTTSYKPASSQQLFSGTCERAGGLGSETPRVSMLVPVYNTQRFLPQCLDSLIGQTIHDVEIIVVDDGSTDSSGTIADEYAARDERIRVIHKSNSGYGDSMNCALAMASAPWIGICEPDDFAQPTLCEHLLATAAALEADGARVDIVKGSYTRLVYPAPSQDNQVATSSLPLHANAGSEPEPQPLELPSPFYKAIHPPHQPFSIDECPLLLTAHPSIWSALYRRSFLDEFGIRFRPIPGAGWADNPFFIETMVAARGIAYLDESVYSYREFEDGTISHLKDWRIIVDRWNEMQDVLNKYDVRIPSILEAHGCRGCAYLQMLHEDFDQSTPGLVEAARAMAATIDHESICRSSLIPKEYKLAYARYLPTSKRSSLLASWIGLHARASLRTLARRMHR